MSDPSGSIWCSRYPSSQSPNDLLPDFRDRVLAFLSQLKDAGAHVSIGDTYRPPERAYLMHWCWMIAREGFDPASVPPMAGVAIDWSAGGTDGAAQMVAGYAIAFEPSITSRHTQRRAIDMTIGWNGTLTITDFNGRSHAISGGPQNGSNPALVAVGKTFGVIKLLADPPHWSDDGH